MGVRDASRRRTEEAILAAARSEIAAVGGVGLSMRKVAREVGLVSSAVYRYFPTREALLTALIVESYLHLAAALDGDESSSGPADHGAFWVGRARALRQWARRHPHEFQLLYGTPVPGYVAPVETIPAAEAVARRFIDAAAPGVVAGFDDPALLRQMVALGGPEQAALIAAVIAELSALVGFVGLELAGHFVGTADPADLLFEALVERQLQTLGLRRR
ncbi:MAG: TetR/AcrR family transcriptional regulator [Mobilicoccus sp.]|nr:TetR/AcrR family transcriptional regulator [Mobilicoccus sp.]